MVTSSRRGGLVVLVVVVDPSPGEALRVVIESRGGQDAAGRDSDVHGVIEQLWQPAGESGLMEPVAEVPVVAARHQDRVRRLQCGQPVLLVERGNRGELKG